MAEYIEREALRKILDEWRDAHADVDDVHGCGLLEDVICEVDAQTAADVAPVVRCEGCKYRIYKHVNDWIGEIGGCSIFNHPMPNDAFCSYGERKDGGDG